MARHPAWFTPRTPAAAECSIPLLLEHGAATKGDAVFAIFQDGSSWSWAEALAATRRTAAGLQKLGLGPGDFLLNWLPNSAAHLRVWFAASMLGAVHVPISVAYRGGLLAHVIANAGARLMVAHAELLPRLADIDPAALTDIVALGGAPSPVAGLRLHPAAALDGDPADLQAPAPPQPWDIAAVIYTSGTTGPSKGVLAPYGHIWTVANAHFGYMTPADRMLLLTPLSHISPISGVMAALSNFGSVVVWESFRTSEFWNVVRRHGVTTLPGLTFAIQEFLAKAPPSPEEAENTLRILNVRAPTESVLDLSRRCHFDYFGSFSMTETSVVLIGEVNSTVRNSCGRPRDGVQVRLVDAHDMEVAPGQPGEIILRPDFPWTMNIGYHRDAEATARAWRNGWFHTGDLARRDADGNYFYVDRLKDSIRRRGENISSSEIEREALQFPGVAHAGAIGVASEFGDEDVLLAVEPMPGATIDPRALLEFLMPRMAHFMLPRLVRIVAQMPVSVSFKVQKEELRRAGRTPDTWDREASGMVVKRDRFTPIA